MLYQLSYLTDHLDRAGPSEGSRLNGTLRIGKPAAVRWRDAADSD